MGILDIIRGKAVTAADMRAKLQRLHAENPHERLPPLERERRRLLREGADDAKVTAIEREIEATLRDAERFDIAREEIEGQIVAAELAENAAALTAERDGAEKE